MTEDKKPVSETRQQLNVLTEEFVKQQEELKKAQRGGNLRLVLSFFDRTKWFFLVTGLLVFLLSAGYGPEVIVEWVKGIGASLGIGDK